MNRRDFFRGSMLAGLAAKIPALAALNAAKVAGVAKAPEPMEEPASKAEIYRQLGFATMTGEDPLKMWARLKNAREWLAGPLAPNGWAGQAFIADHADIFGFRFLSLPAAWMKPQSGSIVQYCAGNFSDWMGIHSWPAGGWPSWWVDVGPKTPDSSYARLVWQMPDGGPQVTYEWARTAANQVVCRITNSIPSAIAIEAYIPWDAEAPKFSLIYSDAPEKRFLRGRSWIPGTRDGMRWVMAWSTPPDETTFGPSSLKPVSSKCQWHGYFKEIETLYLCAQQGQSYAPLEAATEEWMKPGKIDALLESNLKRYLDRRPIGEGWLADVPSAINDQLQWSEVYTPQRRRAYITVSRAWAPSDTNSAPDFLWDSFFSAVLVCQEDEKKSFDLIRDITLWQNDQGMFTQYGQFVSHQFQTGFPVAWGHTQFPVGALAVAKIYLRRPDKEFLAEIYPRLLKAHRWWFADRGDGQPWRDGNRDGLLGLGSNYPEEIPYEDRQQVAYYESYDDSPEWWGVARYNEKTNTLEQDTVERNCLYAMDAWILAWMADELGHGAEAAQLRGEHATMAARINRLLWDPARGCYFNRRWEAKDGSIFFPQQSPDIFFSLLGKVADARQSVALKDLFWDAKKFGGEWILPTISRDDPNYPKQEYWKGKAWAPVNWLAYQGMKIYEWDKESRALAESSAKMFLKPWRAKHECHENFLSTTGAGSSDPHYTWGALMVLIAVEELIDANPWHGLRIGNLNPVEAGAIRRYYVAGSLYDVEISSSHLLAHRDGRQLFEADAPVELRQIEYHQGTVSFELRTARPVSLRIGSASKLIFPEGTHRVSHAAL
jgi:hypothetical protein